MHRLGLRAFIGDWMVRPQSLLPDPDRRWPCRLKSNHWPQISRVVASISLRPLTTATVWWSHCREVTHQRLRQQ